VRGVERVKKRVRVDFLCGLRAAHRARADYLALSHIASAFSAALDDTPALVDHQRGELKDAHAVRDALLGQLAAYQASERLTSTPANSAGRRVIVERMVNGSLETLRPLANAVASRDGAIFVGASNDPPALLLATSPSSGIDAGATLKRVLADSGGRGGGSPRFAQGSLRTIEALESALAVLGTSFS
jgi:alanyl-tRNA synthetase